MRGTILQRGSLRFLVTTITFSAWAAILITTCAVFVVPMFAVVPLAVLGAGFEVNLAIHAGVERIGRYLQVQYESKGQTAAAWERTAMKLRVPTGGVDPLFLAVFLIALGVNWLMGMWTSSREPGVSEINGISVEVLVFAGLHAAVAGRWLFAARFARSQRARELRAFEDLQKS